MQNVNWQYFLTEVIKQVDKPKKENYLTKEACIFLKIFYQIIELKEEYMQFCIRKLLKALRDI